ncbi:hypothetical protein ACQ4PT_028924 [Festuca glaucescens]
MFQLPWSSGTRVRKKSDLRRTATWSLPARPRRGANEGISPSRCLRKRPMRGGRWSAWKPGRKVLLACEDTDEETIVRSWDLLVLATVLNLGTGNMLSMDYLGSLAEPFSSVELAWDQHILDECMLHVQKIQEKQAKLRSKGVIVYMDDLEFPPNEYVIDYSLLRACHVKSKDFEFVVATDIDKKKLFNSTIFARRPVPARYKHLYDKHKAIYAADVDATIKNLGVGLKRMYSQHVDFHADEVEDYPKVHARSGILDVPQPAILVDSSCKEGYTGELQCVDSPVRSPFCSSIPRGISAEAWNRAPDPPSMDMFPPGSEEFEDFNRIPDSPSHNSVAAAGDDTAVSSVEKPAAMSAVEKPPVVEKIASVEKHGAASAVEKPPAMEKPPAVEKPPAATTEAEASVQNLVIVDAANLGEPKTPVGPKSADSVEKDATTGVDTVDKRNRAKRAAKDELTPPKMKKIQLKLIVDPATFNPNECMKDFKSAVSQFKMLKDDLFTNFRRLVNESGVAKIDWTLYNLTTPDHPQQSTTFDCGFFSVLYMDQFNGKVTADFDDKVIPDLRKYLVASLINNRDNAELVDKLMDVEVQVK